MRFFFARTKLTVALMGAVLVLLGVVMLSDPVGMTLTVTRLVGVACALAGGGALFESARVEGSLSGISAGSLIVGGLPLAFGIIVFLFPEAFVSLLFTIVGVGILLTGVGDIARAGELRDSQTGGRQLTLGVGIVTVLLGLLVILAPLGAASLVPTIAGVCLVMDGASEIVLALRM